jgi:magnesium transporter
MRKLFVARSKKAGLPPGTLVHVGDEKSREVVVTVMEFDETRFRSERVDMTGDCFAIADKSAVTWINVDGIHQVEILERLGSSLTVHPLVLEDIANTGQRPKLEDYDQYLFVVLKMFRYGEQGSTVEVEQVSLILGPSFVISFQEEPSDVFDAIRTRIREGRGRIRRMGADYLAYALLDALVDSYFVVLEVIGERVEFLEEELISRPTPETLEAIHRLKRDVLLLRKSVQPVREVVSSLTRGELEMVGNSITLYLRDLHDHTNQVIDTIETFREMVSGMLDIYLSSVSNRMNEVMKLLTVIATVFIPLTFIVGLYGMNFRYMPELGWRWGYPLTWVVMLAIAAAMLAYFRRKKWL